MQDDCEHWFVYSVVCLKGPGFLKVSAATHVGCYCQCAMCLSHEPTHVVT